MSSDATSATFRLIQPQSLLWVKSGHLPMSALRQKRTFVSARWRITLPAPRDGAVPSSAGAPHRAPAWQFYSGDSPSTHSRQFWAGRANGETAEPSRPIRPRIAAATIRHWEDILPPHRAAWRLKNWHNGAPYSGEISSFLKARHKLNALKL